MPVKQFKPYTPSRRSMSVEDFSWLTKKAPEKRLLRPLSKTGGRNNTGMIMVRHIGGRHARQYRLIDFKRNKFGVPGKVAAFEYDPNRSARLALIHYKDGDKRYILYPHGLLIGDTIMSGPTADIKIGNALPLINIPEGTVVHNIELVSGKGAQLARSAESFWRELSRWLRRRRALLLPGAQRRRDQTKLSFARIIYSSTAALCAAFSRSG